MTEQENLIWLKIQKQKRQDSRARAFSIISRILLLFTVGSFLFSPCFQLILRITNYHDAEWYNIRRTIFIYQDMVQKVNILALFTAVLCYGYYVVWMFRNRKKLIIFPEKVNDNRQES